MDNNLVEFRGAEILDLEAKVLQEIEMQLGLQLNFCKSQYQSGAHFGFTTKNNRVVGVFLNSCENLSLPESIGKLKSLEYLHLQNVQLDSLPEDIGEFTNLKILTLSENFIDRLPDSIGNLKSLRKLNLERN